jgi:glucose/arabinose dehydrogenase
MRASSGGGQTKAPARRVNPRDILLPGGYQIEPVATGLTLPTGVAFDAQGHAYVTESGYAYGEKWTTPRLLRVNDDGSTSVVAEGDHAPWNGVDFHNGAFYVAQGGAQGGGGRIVRIRPDGTQDVLLDNIPSVGDHHTNGPRVSKDGWLYFGVGTATNSAVVGTDSAKFGWLARHPQFHDIPGKDIRLAGQNFETDNPLTTGNKRDRAVTGAYLPFGTPSTPGQIIKGQTLCTGAILRVRPEGGDPELVAWGLRNPFGLAFSPEGRLYATENSYDVRGSRPVWGAGDVLWAIDGMGKWYGWPDFHGSTPLTQSDHYRSPGSEAPKFLLAEHPDEPPDPVVKLPVHGSADGIDFAPQDASFGYGGEAFIAQFGDMSPAVGKTLAPVGFNVVRVDVRSGVIHDFAANRAKNGQRYGPASRLKSGGLERPTAVRFSPDGSALYVVDFGVMTVGKSGPNAREGTGVLWRITKEGGR